MWLFTEDRERWVLQIAPQKDDELANGKRSGYGLISEIACRIFGDQFRIRDFTVYLVWEDDPYVEGVVELLAGYKSDEPIERYEWLYLGGRVDAAYIYPTHRS